MDALAVSNDWEISFEVYHSLEEQQLLPEIASCLSIKALLAIHNLDDRYTVQMRSNAEQMAPKQGDLPFLRHKNHVIGGSDIMNFLKEKEYVLNTEQTPEENVINLGVLSLIQSKLIPAEMLVTWINSKNAIETSKRYGFEKPEPLKTILYFQKRQQVQRYLNEVGWLNKSEETVGREIQEVFAYFSKRLENNKCLTGESLTEADVFLFGHLQAIIECPLEENILSKVLAQFPRLQKFCLNFNQLHLGQQAMLFS